MTTSYPLSLRLKELGVEQEGGEYYWVEGKLTGALYCHHKLAENKEYDSEGYEERYTILCRALTLGEVVRELPDFTTILKLNGIFTIGGASYTVFIHNQSPEEAAGELLAAIKEQRVC